MADLDAETFLILHDVRLRGIVELDDSEHLIVLVEQELVARSPRGIRITKEGRELHSQLARLERESEIEQVAQRAYERFMPMNRELIRICNDWQVRPGNVPNDHRDVRYDWEVVDRLRALDERASPVVSRLGRSVDRFSAYTRRLRAALAKVDAGDTEWLTSPRIDSYHTVWMQFHEDLLLAIGVERSSEAME